MKGSSQFRQALEDGDFRQLQMIWGSINPHLPAPSSDDESEVTMHMTRTSASWLKFDKRAYSHRWLTERNLPSQLPDRLRPSAERMYPQVVDAVGISCSSGKDWLQPAIPIIRGAMEYAVLECFGDNERDPVVVKSRMMEKRRHAMRQLFGGAHG